MQVGDVLSSFSPVEPGLRLQVARHSQELIQHVARPMACLTLVVQVIPTRLPARTLQ
jgi:hypothetical protein